MTDALSSLYVAIPVVTGTPAPEGADVQKAAEGTDEIMASLANVTVQAYSELSNYASLFEESDDAIEKQVASVRATPKEITGARRPSNPYTSVEDDDDTTATWRSANNVTAASRTAGEEKPVSAGERATPARPLAPLCGMRRQPASRARAAPCHPPATPIVNAAACIAWSLLRPLTWYPTRAVLCRGCWH